MGKWALAAVLAWYLWDRARREDDKRRALASGYNLLNYVPRGR